MDDRLLWWVFGVTKGGLQRAKIIKMLKERPANANQLAKKTGLDYKTVRYHLGILDNYKLISPRGDKVVMYFISKEMEESFGKFLKICEALEE